MQLIKNGLTIREAKVHMKTQKSSHYDPMHASTLEPYACIKGVKLQLKQQSHYCFGLLANMELSLGYGNSMGNTTQFFKKPLCKPKIRDPHKGANMLHLTSLEITEQCDRRTQKTYLRLILFS